MNLSLNENFGAWFDRDPNLIYLNSANLSLCPREVLESITRYQREFEKNPTVGLAQAWKFLWRAQSELARFLNADAQDLFLRTNVTATLNTFLLGMPLPPGSEILVGELEYGAIVNICRLRAQRDQLQWRMLRMPQTEAALRDLNPKDLTNLIVSQLGPKTKLLLISHVVAGTGLALPLAEMARETRARDCFLAVDGAYAPGALTVDFSELSDVDFYGCSLYKWMMGPKGTAFGWIPKRHQSAIRPLNAGWATYDTAGPITDFGEGSAFQRAFLMAGCHDFAPFRSIEDTLLFWKTHGVDRIQSRMKELAHYLGETVAHHLGWSLLQAKDESLQSPLRVYRLPAPFQSQGLRLAERLLKEFKIQINMVCLRGQWHIAFSPHVYNTENEIALAVSRLREVAL